MIFIIPRCFYCKNYDIKDNRKHSCKAFPKGIPENVINNKKKHNKKIKSQIGDYIFEEKS